MNQYLAFTLGGLMLLVTACVTGERPEAMLRREFPSVVIQRLGAHDILYADFGDRAVLNALHRLVQAGVPKENIEHVALTAESGRHRAISGRFGRSRPDSYDLWLRISDCDKLFYMRANFNGRVVTVRDRGGCLKPTAGPSLQ